MVGGAMTLYCDVPDEALIAHQDGDLRKALAAGRADHAARQLVLAALLTSPALLAAPVTAPHLFHAPVAGVEGA